MHNEINDGVRRLFIAALSCVIGEGKAIYVSTPITNGPLLLEKIANDKKLLDLSEKDFAAYVCREIVPANEDRARRFVRKLRNMGLGIVIDPSAFFSDDLAQEDYLILWGEVIKRFAIAVWFNRGWAFSKGCVAEYCIAIENGISTFDDEGNELSVAQAVDQISKAIVAFATVGWDVSALEKQVDSLMGFSSGFSI